MCVALSDRSRSVTIASSLSPNVRVSLAVQGPGLVRVENSGLECDSSSPCDFNFPRGDSLSLSVIPPVSRRVVVSWSPPCGPGLTCGLIASDDLQLTATITPVVELSVLAVGQGSLHVNGVAEALPFRGLLTEGSQVTLEAFPSAEAVLAGFEGFVCALPRKLTECQFILSTDTQGTVRFAQFYRWLSGGWQRAIVSDLAVRDSGVLMLGSFVDRGVGVARYGKQSFVAELTPDGGLGQVSASQLGFDEAHFLEMPDGGLWLSGAFESHRLRGYVTMWAGVDAGLLDDGGVFARPPDLVMMQFNESAFAPVSATVLDFSPFLSNVYVGPDPVIPIEDGLFTSFSHERFTDGGTRVWGHKSIGAFDGELRLLSSEALSSISHPSVLEYPFGVVALSLFDPAAAVNNTCSQPLSDTVPLLSSVVGGGLCLPSVSGKGPADYYMTIGRLGRGFETPIFQAMTSQNLPVGAGGQMINVSFGTIHSHDASLAQRWVMKIEPVFPPGPVRGPTALWPLAVLPWKGRVLSMFWGGGAGVGGYRGPSGLTIECDSRADGHLLMTLHDVVTGDMTWGHCINDNPQPQVSLLFGAGSVDISGTAPTLAYGGVVIPALVVNSTFPLVAAAVPWGPTSLTVTETSSVVGLVTPP